MSACQFDVVVVGAGPAGSIAAHCLARAGLRVSLIDRAATPASRPTELLAPAAVPLLHALDLAEVLAPTKCGARAALGIRSTWGGHELVDDFISHPGGDGYFLDRCQFDHLLRERAASSGAEVLLGVNVSGVARGVSGWIVRLSPDASLCEVTGRFLVDATGRSAGLVRRLGAVRVTSDRLIATYTPSRSRESRWLTIEAGRDGWRYEMDGAAVLVTDSGQDRVRGSTFDASSATLQSASGSDWLAVGDSACSFDPIAGQGLFQAIASGQAGAEAISSHFRGKLAALQEYSVSVHATWCRTESQRFAMYASEVRWPAAPFWRRRAQAAAAFDSTNERLHRG